jgi:hypothetical protein
MAAEAKKEICEVKHGMRIAVTNLYSGEVGNSQLPKSSKR